MRFTSQLLVAGCDRPRCVCVRLPCHVDAEQAMHAADSMPCSARGTSTARHAARRCRPCTRLLYSGFDAWFILHTRFRRRAVRLVHRTLMFPAGVLTAHCHAPPFPNSGFLTSSHLVSLPVVSRLRGGCARHITSAGRKIMGIGTQEVVGDLWCRSAFCCRFCSVASAPRPCPETRLRSSLAGDSFFLQLHVSPHVELISNLPGNIP